MGYIYTQTAFLACTAATGFEHSTSTTAGSESQRYCMDGSLLIYLGLFIEIGLISTMMR